MTQRACRVRMRMCVVGVAACLVGGAVIAGDLSPPPGPVMPTMKTLDEVEPRTPLDPADIPITINQAGSYYLTGNFSALVSGQNAITINADNVTLDLRGFTIRNTEIGFFNNGVAIASTAENVRVLNGTIVGCAESGVSGSGARGCAVFNVRAMSCGDQGIILGNDALIQGCTTLDNTLTGIFCGDNSTIENCVANNNQSGIRAASGSTVRGCAASDNTSSGIIVSGNGVIAQCSATGNASAGILTGFSSTVTQCSARDNTFDGINVGAGSLVERCTAYSNDRNGIGTSTNCKVLDCAASSNAEHGIQVSSDALVTGNMCDGNGTAIADGAGVAVTGSDGRIDGNHCTDNDIGFLATSTGNLFIRNSTKGSPTPFSTVIGNDVATIQASPIGAGPWDNFNF